MQWNFSPSWEVLQLVPKLWGAERILVNSDKYCAKLLEIKGGYQCSLHRHSKTESFFVLDGMVDIEVGDERLTLFSQDAVHIPSMTWHRFSSKDGAIILEISTPHKDADVERQTESGPIT